MDREPPQTNGDGGESGTTNDQTNHPSNPQLASPIADAIHTYRRYRHADERHRAQRERVTIVVLGLTSIFALFAAGAAIYSAVILYGQLSEMQSAERSQISFIRVDYDGTFRPEGYTYIPAIWQNSGKSLATVKIKGACSDNEPFQFGTGPNGTPAVIRYNVVLGPQVSLPLRGCQVDRAIIEKVNSRQTVLYVYGQAIYTDSGSDKRERVTQFCIGFRELQIPWIFALSDNTIVCNEHNCTDDECRSKYGPPVE